MLGEQGGQQESDLGLRAKKQITADKNKETAPGRGQPSSGRNRRIPRRKTNLRGKAQRDGGSWRMPGMAMGIPEDISHHQPQRRRNTRKKALEGCSSPSATAQHSAPSCRTNPSLFFLQAHEHCQHQGAEQEPLQPGKTSKLKKPPSMFLGGGNISTGSERHQWRAQGYGPVEFLSHPGSSLSAPAPAHSTQLQEVQPSEGTQNPRECNECSAAKGSSQAREMPTCARAAPRMCSQSSCHSSPVLASTSAQDKQNTSTRPEPMHFCSRPELWHSCCTWGAPALLAHRAPR